MPEVSIKLRPRYSKGFSYKSQKAKVSNSGSTKKNRVSGKSVKNNVTGGRVLYINMSGEPEYCEQTKVRLPFRGMVWKHDGKKFISQEAIAAYERAKVQASDN